MTSMVFVFTRYNGEHGKIIANLANTRLRRGGVEVSYTHALSVEQNHRSAAVDWVLRKMPGVKPQPIGVQSFDNGYCFAFAI